ncbi:hypothetical protein [Palleronia marisminoris]|uniref:hypothetical protein n=1 Tax=Palleronia marisminoris TaxID=315423 RepID=UPI0011137019|nr:hypothetical protein [Palleronia marisminoris]
MDNVAHDTPPLTRNKPDAQRTVDHEPMHLELSPLESAETYEALCRIWQIDRNPETETECRRAAVAELTALYPHEIPFVAELADAVDTLLCNFEIDGVRLHQVAALVGCTTRARLACALAGLVRRCDGSGAITFWHPDVPDKDRRTAHAACLSEFRWTGEAFIWVE